MYSLIIDSATKILYIALVKDETVVYEKYVEGFNDHATNIVLLAKEALKQENINVKDLSKVIIGNGPGSYTGVRMGVVVGKMFCSFTEVKLYQISTLFLMSSGYSGNCLVMIDARRGNSFSAFYKNYEVVIEESLRNTEELLNSITDDYIIVNESNMKVCPSTVIKYSNIVDKPDSFVPNYLRETEAQRNKDAN